MYIYMFQYYTKAKEIDCILQLKKTDIQFWKEKLTGWDWYPNLPLAEHLCFLLHCQKGILTKLKKAMTWWVQEWVVIWRCQPHVLAKSQLKKKKQ